MSLAWTQPVQAAGHLGPARYLHRQGSKTLPELLRAELDAAGKRKEAVLVMFTADWCSPCKEVKQFVAGSAVVRKALAHARFLYIDVDEWRGPAQKLLPGVDASKLPTLALVDREQKAARTCYGTDLGLLSEDAVAHNLARVLANQAPEKPAYADKPEVEHELMLQHANAQTATTKGVPQLEVKAQGVRDGVRRVKLVIRNHDGPRRWFLVPARLDAPLSEHPTVAQWQQVRWTEHVRADFLHLDGNPEFYAVPVAGFGSVELDDWPLPEVAKMEGAKARGAKAGKLEVWELDRLALDGQEQPFQMKLPYELKIAHPDQQAVTRKSMTAKVEVRIHARHAATVPK
jgi:thiol-disulfide isomerase/thioredoxin